MLRQSVKTLVVAAAASLFVAGTAAATSLSLQYLGAASGYRYLTIQESPVTPATNAMPTNVLAGAFRMRDTATDSVFGDFIAWCLDISHWLGTSGTHSYKTTTTPFSNGYSLDAAQQSRVQGFFDANYFAGLESNAAQSAGFQMGLWEVLYDDDYSLTDNVVLATDEFRGTFGIVDGSATSAGSLANKAALDLAEGVGGYLETAFGYTGPKKWNLTFLESTGANAQQKQNLVTVSAVPLPAAGLLLIGGLAGLGFVARRRRRS